MDNQKVIRLLVLMLWLCGSVWAQDRISNKKITIHEEQATIASVIKKLEQNYHLNFSYANNLVPLEKKVSVHAENKPLSYVLDILFKDASIDYRFVGNQIVLTKGKSQSSVSKDDRSKINSNEPIQEPVVSTHVDSIIEDKNKVEQSISVSNVLAPDTSSREVVIDLSVKPQQIQDSSDIRELRKQYAKERKRLRKEYLLKRDSLHRAQGKTEGPLQGSLETIKNQMESIKDTLKNMDFHFWKDSMRNEKNPAPYKTKDSLEQGNEEEYVPVQVTFISPIGTNGHRCGQIVNGLSFNVLGGYAGGLRGFEFGSLVNVEKKYVKGMQFSGFANVSKGPVLGAQVAGFTNVNGDSTDAIQFAGFCNVSRRSVYGGQFSGFCNVSGGAMSGPQFAGFSNTTRDSVNGVQGAGFCNVSGGSVKGAQLAGFINVANGNVEGTQVSGFMNIASGYVKGVQLGFINVADSVKGASIGFLSFAGYYKLEISGSEALYGNLIFKTGTKKFYNILAAGIQPYQLNQMRWAFGYGLGTEAKLSNKSLINVDWITYQVNENEAFTKNINLLSQLKVLYGFRLGKTAQLFAGPTINYMISDYKNPDKAFALGSGISDNGWLLYDHTTFDQFDLNHKLWLGINAGIRF